MAPYSLLIALCLAATCNAYQGRGWWLQQPYDEDDQFNTQAEYGENYIIQCGNISELEGTVTVDYWLIPDMQIIDTPNMTVEYLTLDGTSRTQWIDDDGLELNVSLVIENQFGFYYCHGEIDGEKFVRKRSINYQGPYFGDTWEIYRMNTIVGCSAAAAFLIIAGVSYFVYEWKFSDDDNNASDSKEDDKQSKPGTSNGVSSVSSNYENQGFTGVDVIDKQPPPSHIEDTTAL